MDVDIAALLLRSLGGAGHPFLSTDDLAQRAVDRGEADLDADGNLIVRCSTDRGRSAGITRIVADGAFGATWDPTGSALGTATTAELDELLVRVADHLGGVQVFSCVARVGTNDPRGLLVRVITDRAWLAAFARNTWFDPHQPAAGESHPEVFTVVHIVGAPADWGKAQTVIDIDRRLAVVAGTDHAGEVKNPVITYLAHELLGRGTLPLHASANHNPSTGAVSLFVGLSGTGKSTLARSGSRAIVGDDFHGWSAEGVFSFDRSFYGSALEVLGSGEPQLRPGISRLGAVVQHAVLDPERKAIDWSATPQRSAASCCFPIEVLDAPGEYRGEAGPPDNVFFLVADRSGVLPALCGLTPLQAARLYLVGYTSKMPDSEAGVDRAVATFSSCFAAPYLLRPPVNYARRLLSLLEGSSTSLWLLNTGWFGPGGSRRVPLVHTRALVDAVERGLVSFEGLSGLSPVGYRYLTSLPGIEPAIIDPRRTWLRSDSYQQAGASLAEAIVERVAGQL